MFKHLIVERKTSKMALGKDNRKERLKKYKAEKGPHTRTKQVRDITSPPPMLHRGDHPVRDAESPERSRLIRVDFDNVPGSFEKNQALDQVVQLKNSQLLALALGGKKPELPHYECVDAVPGVRSKLFT